MKVQRALGSQRGTIITLPFGESVRVRGDFRVNPHEPPAHKGARKSLSPGGERARVRGDFRVKCLTSQKGFTLLELLIALTILAIGLLGLAGLHISAIQGNVSSFKLSTATAVAQERVEELKALSPASAELSAGTHADDGSVTVQGIAYNRSYTIQDDTPVTGTSTLILTVSWTEPGTGAVRSTRLFTRLVKG